MREWDEFVDENLLGERKDTGKSFILGERDDYVKCKVLAAIADNLGTLTDAVQGIKNFVEMGYCSCQQKS